MRSKEKSSHRKTKASQTRDHLALLKPLLLRGKEEQSSKVGKSARGISPPARSVANWRLKRDEERKIVKDLSRGRASC